MAIPKLTREETRGKADPAIYLKLRELILRRPVTGVADGAVCALLMDWPITNGTMTAMAAFDGSASIYLSSGGGFIGGGQEHPEIREAALDAVRIATGLLAYFQPAVTHDIPPAGEILFYATTTAGVRVAAAAEIHLKTGLGPLCPLGAAMQKMITLYRLSQQRPGASARNVQ
jgi:hypothetical protein